MCNDFRYVTQHNYSQRDQQGLRNIRLHVLQFRQRDPDSPKSLRIRPELELCACVCVCERERERGGGGGSPGV